MEPITLTFSINPDLGLTENTKKLLKITSLSEMEFFSRESVSEKPDHVYSIDGLSILGTPAYVNGRLKTLCDQFYSYLQDLINGEDSFEEKICQLEEVIYHIQEFKINNEVNTGFLTDVPNIFNLHCKDEIMTEVTLNQVSLSSGHRVEINEHLAVRDKHFTLLEKRIALLKKNLEVEQMRAQIENSGYDEARAMALLEVWISLEAIGFLSHITAKDKGIKIPALRKQFFGIFGQSDINYKKLRSRLMDRKYARPDVLTKLTEVYEKALHKKLK